MHGKCFLIVLLFFFFSNAFGQQLINFTDGSTIPDYSSRILNQDINLNHNYDKLELIVDINHSWINDLELEITNPEGNKAIIFSRLGNGSCFGCDGEDILMTFADDAWISYDSLNGTCGVKPAYSGQSKPMQSLDDLLSGDPNGAWTIEIKDIWPCESGMINDLSLNFSNYLPPACTEISYPPDQGENILLNATLTWEPVVSANGYLLNIGTESGLYDIIHEMDLGNTNSYQLDLDTCNKLHYASIIPYNNYGTASACQEISFLTEFVTAEAPDSLEICKGDTIQLFVSGGVHYEWSPIDFLDSPFSNDPLFFGQENTDYTLIVSNENGCLDTAYITLEVNEINFQIDTINHVRLNSSGFIEVSVDGDPDQFSFLWSGPNGFMEDTEDIDGLEIGAYTLNIEDLQSGCSLDTLIFVDDLTNISLNNNKSDLRIYPNPFQNNIILDWEMKKNTSVQVQLFSSTGVNQFEMTSEKMQDIINLNTSELLPGIYLLKVLDEHSGVQQSYLLIKCVQ